MKVKICGIKTLVDARAALDAGADLLGFNFYSPSPRYIAPLACAELVKELRQLGCSARLVGVFVNAPAEEVASILDQCDLDLAQLSGDEPPEVLAALKGAAYKALRPAGQTALDDSLVRYMSLTNNPAWLVDAFHPTAYGGTGRMADWSLARRLAGETPILLAGGLTADNVAEAIRQVRPWGVDVASGVESAPGVKDPTRIRAFIQAAREA